MAHLDYASIKTWFFDTKVVLDAADRGTLLALSKFGAFVRQRSRTSIRQRKAVSVPGSPPSSHTGLLKRAIFFAYDPGRRSVVIGPVPMGRSGQGARVLEEGGTLPVRSLRKGRPLVYRARPYMRPAFMAELPNAPAQFKEMVR